MLGEVEAIDRDNIMKSGWQQGDHDVGRRHELPSCFGVFDRESGRNRVWSIACFRKRVVDISVEHGEVPVICR